MAEFDDGKDEGALRTIGEVGRALGIKTHVLRYWEQQFPMLQPLKRSGGRRYYRTEDVELVRAIDRLVNEQGYTLKGARSALKGTGGARLLDGDRAGSEEGETDRAGEASATPPADILSRLKAIRGDLAAALAA